MPPGRGYGLLSNPLNPLLRGGLTMMAEGGPSKFPVSLPQAAHKGLLAMQKTQRENAEFGLLQDKRKEESLLNELKRRKYEQDLSDPMRGLKAVSAGQTIVNPRTGEVMYSAPHKPQSSKPNQAEKYLEVKYGPNWRGNPKAIAEWEKIILKPGVQVMPPPSVRALPGNQGLATLTPRPGGGFNVERIPGTSPKEKARAEFGEVAEAYWKLGKNTSGFDVKGRERVRQLKERLVMMLARVNNPGAQMTDDDVRIARGVVPDAFGIYDAWVFDAAMDSFIKANTGKFSGADTSEPARGEEKSVTGADTSEPARGEEKSVTRYRYDSKTGELVKQP